MAIQLQPLAGCSFRTFLKLLFENRGVDLRYVPRALIILGLCALGGIARVTERKWFEQKVKPLKIQNDPIFVIGHWRSGTTFLHTLLSQDKQFGYISNYQAWLPEQSLGDWPIARMLVEKNLPNKRPMDNMTMDLDSPQEEEYSLGNLGLYGFYHGWSFPRSIQKYFDQNVLFEGVSLAFREQWKKAYLKVIQIANYKNQGKPLILKNPANAARIKILLEMFPNAKFIHIYRNPYAVYLSTKNLYRKLLPIHTFQTFDMQKIDADILVFYEKLMQKFLEDQHLIPAGNLIEIKYERLEENPLREITKIYEQFGWTFDLAKMEMERYLSTQKNYCKNQYALEVEAIEKVSTHCQFALDHWGYKISDLNDELVGTSAL
jgi:omega-hydroxy-beta-dihydromenaquinone-9 sulfotransferase